MPTILGFLDRLRRKPEALAHVFRRRSSHVWHLVSKALPVFVQAPGEGGRPAKAALDEDKFELGKSLGHAFEHETRELGGHGMGVRMVLFVVVRGPATPRGGVTAIPADVNSERQVCRLGSGVKRPIAAAS